MQVNTANFIRWNDQNIDPGLPDVPFAYWRDRENCGYMPIFSPGESHSFYVNSRVGFKFFAEDEVVELDTIRLAIIRADNEEELEQNLPINFHQLPNDPQGRYNPYSTFVIPAAEDGVYYMRIFDGNTGQTLLTSNYVNFRNDRQKLLNTTTFCRFRHDRFFYNIRYHDIPDFYQEVRLGISLADHPVIEGENEIYTEVTTGEAVILESSEKLPKKFETYHFDPAAALACGIMIKHRFVELNGVRHTFKSGYKTAANPLSKHAKGEFELYDQSFAQINRC